MHLKLLEKFALGLPEARFWQAFVQCIGCKLVLLREGVIRHRCLATTAPVTRQQRQHPYSSSARRVRTRLAITPGDGPQYSDFRSLRASPAPTEIDETLDGENAVGHVHVDSDDSNGAGVGDEAEVVLPLGNIEAETSSDHELPTILEIIRARRTSA